MIASICTIYDEVCDNYSAPITLANDEAAKRHMEVLATKENELIVKDLKMYKLGTYDTDSAKIEVLPEPELLIRGDQVVKKKVQKNKTSC